MDPYHAFAYPVRIIKDEPSLPVGGLVVVGRDGKFLSLGNLNEDKSIKSAFNGNTKITGFDFPDGIGFGGAEDAEDAFRACTSLEGFREGVTFGSLKTGKGMFNGCTKLVTLPSTIVFDKLEDGEEMFKGCTALKSIPRGVTLRNLKNCKSMFEGCTLLRDVPDSLDLAALAQATFYWQQQRMFSGCCLSARSVKNVLNALPQTSEQLNFDIGLTHNDPRYDPDPVDWRYDEEIAAMLNTETPIDFHRRTYYDMDKGWRIYIEG